MGDYSVVYIFIYHNYPRLKRRITISMFPPSFPFLVPLIHCIHYYYYITDYNLLTAPGRIFPPNNPEVEDVAVAADAVEVVLLLLLLELFEDVYVAVDDVDTLLLVWLLVAKVVDVEDAEFGVVESVADAATAEDVEEDADGADADCVEDDRIDEGVDVTVEPVVGVEYEDEDIVLVTKVDDLADEDENVDEDKNADGDETADEDETIDDEETIADAVELTEG